MNNNNNNNNNNNILDNINRRVSSNINDTVINNNFINDVNINIDSSTGVKIVDENLSKLGVNSDGVRVDWDVESVKKYIKDNIGEDFDLNEDTELSEILNGNDSSSIKESFPWLYHEGKAIKFNKDISIFEGVKYISGYLAHKYDEKSGNFSDEKLTSLLEVFISENEGVNNTEGGRVINKVSVIELYKHISNLYEKDKSLVLGCLDKQESDNTNENVINNLNNNSESELLSDINTVKYKIWGEFGDRPFTLNKVTDIIMNAKWKQIFDGVSYTVHFAPLFINIISYKMILHGYMTKVHNRPYNNVIPKHLQIKQRNRMLNIFSIIGVPMTIGLLRLSSLGLSDIFEVKGNLGELSGQITDTDSSTQKIGFFLILNKIKNIIPNKYLFLLKFIFSFIIIMYIILKLLGYSVLDVFMFNNVLKIYFYISGSLVISYLLLDLYLIHLFSKKNINISQVLPDFIINWLEEYKIKSESKESINYFKNENYIHLFIFIILILLVILI